MKSPNVKAECQSLFVSNRVEHLTFNPATSSRIRLRKISETVSSHCTRLCTACHSFNILPTDNPEANSKVERLSVKLCSEVSSKIQNGRLRRMHDPSTRATSTPWAAPASASHPLRMIREQVPIIQLFDKYLLNYLFTGLAQAPQANKENRPTVRAELFLNLGSPGNGSPSKRNSVLPPSANLAMQNDSHDGGGLPLNRGRSATTDNNTNLNGPAKKKGGPSVASPVDPKGWGFEFVDLPPPEQEEDPVEKEKKATNTDFDKMLVRFRF